MAEWRDIPGYEGLYRVSSDGRVKSLARQKRLPRGGLLQLPESLLKPFLRNGYLSVALYREGERTQFSVHRLVARIYLADQYFDGAEVCHGDGCRTNNCVSNLRWGTGSDNIQDALRHGTHWQIAKTNCPKGHPYSPENTRVIHRRGGNERQCRECGRARDRRRTKERTS